ncbi:glycosyltransferase family 87 protein [Myceligenerans crystallogenes]|uniref:glycosyltransferase family 87 protein n=1 Tax=Myceligenerans crystallogenes TaxID=316335 RepID=UPI0031D8177B
MTTEPRPPRALARVLFSPWAITVAFVAVHAWLIQDAWKWKPQIFGDVGLYEWWVRNGISTGHWPVFDESWVYPVGALLAITPPAWFSQTPDGYAWVWLSLVTALDAVATVFLVRARPRGPLGAWFWLIFLLALGPIFLGRLDGVIAPVILLALVISARHPAVAMTLATLGAWIKIAPGAAAVAIAATARSWTGFARHVVLPGAVVSVLVIGWALVMGSGSRVLDVFGEQSDRALQVEAVGATPFLLMGLNNPEYDPVWNDVIYTYEILGAAPGALAEALDIALPLVVLLLAALAWFAVRRRPERAHDVLLLVAAAELLALIVFNKVGSPQFIAWIGPPVAVAIALYGGGTAAARRTWLPPALGMLVTAYLTYLIFPVRYGEFLGGFQYMIVVGAVRNGLLVALLLGAIVRLVQIAVASPHREAEPVPEPAAAPALQKEQDDT